MRISTNILGNFFTCFDEARGFAINKRKIIENKRACGLSYTQNSSVIFIILLFISLMLILIDKSFFAYSLIAFFIAIIYSIAVTIRIYSSYMFKKSYGFNNSIEMNEEGMTDKSFHGIKITISWDKVKAIVVGKHTITVLTDTPIYFYFNICDKDRILNYCLKYIDKDKIIY